MRIQEVAKKCDEPFRETAFRLMLTRALQDDTQGGGLRHAAQERKATAPEINGSTSPPSGKAYEQFLKRHNIQSDTIHALLDLSSGQVLAHNLGKNNADRQRSIAALVGLWHLHHDKAPLAPQEEIVRECKRFGCYDANNFAAVMNRTKVGSTSVFAVEPNGWRVTVPGEAFIAEVIKSALVEVPA